MMMVAADGSIIYLVAFVKVNNITCRVLLDTGAGSSYHPQHFEQTAI